MGVPHVASGTLCDFGRWVASSLSVRHILWEKNRKKKSDFSPEENPASLVSSRAAERGTAPLHCRPSTLDTK